jgi:hypothetical protein
MKVSNRRDRSNSRDSRDGMSTKKMGNSRDFIEAKSSREAYNSGHASSNRDVRNSCDDHSKYHTVVYNQSKLMLNKIDP